MNNEHLYAVALKSCHQLGNLNFRKLIDEFGSAENVWQLPKSELKQIFGIGDKRVEEIGSEKHLDFAASELKFCQKNKIQIISINDKAYPTLLKECPDAPALLFVKGQLPKKTRNISIVGTRNITSYGKQFIDEFLTEIKSKNAATVSGLAYGVDAQVHEKSLQLEIPTLAVLAHGLHMIYPSKHHRLSHLIIENGGAIISEYTSKSKPDREHFLQRNRIIAGLSQQCIIVESAFGGGSMNTANFANDYNRDVFALPGKLTDKYSQGCNLLISQNKAQIIHSISDLVQACFTNQMEIGNLFEQFEIPSIDNPIQLEIYHLIQEKISISFDELLDKTDKNSQELLNILLEMELLGYIKSHSGKNYSCSNY
ncbi:DNA-processing protein DprA [Soonwooa sp.]|uniref:DNA-processing protein DprA n=1 Tax=Soonwooa sp. TaxID=1938592 RepID=UPI002627B0DB|nr:DNA-processing protein DprA [Soonwooa sp.]